MSSTSDPLSGAGIALAAIGTGAAAGGLVVCAVLAAAYGLPRGPESTFAALTLTGAACSLFVGAAAGFLAGRPLGTWRALLTGIVAASGAALVAILTTVADMLAGRGGLVGLGALCLLVLVLLARMRRNARPA